MKTPEQIKAAVLAECERLMPLESSWHRISIGVGLSRADNDDSTFIGARLSKYNGSLSIFEVSPSMDAENPNFFVAYRLLGLEAREERERAEKLVKALEEIQSAMQSVEEHPDYGLDNDGRFCMNVSSKALNEWKEGQGNG